jgi:hypothetical protein
VTLAVRQARHATWAFIDGPLRGDFNPPQVLAGQQPETLLLGQLLPADVPHIPHLFAVDQHCWRRLHRPDVGWLYSAQPG